MVSSPSNHLAIVLSFSQRLPLTSMPVQRGARTIRYYSAFRRDIPEFGVGTNVLRSRLPWV